MINLKKYYFRFLAVAEAAKMGRPLSRNPPKRGPAPQHCPNQITTEQGFESLPKIWVSTQSPC